MNDKLLRAINIIFNILPWTLIIIRQSFDWALEDPIATYLIIGYIIFMILGGIFSLVSKKLSNSSNTFFNASILINVVYLIVGIVLALLIVKTRY